MSRKNDGYQPPSPPALDALPLVHASDDAARWLEHYWLKLGLPREALGRLAITNDRQEFAQWTGRRLNPMALGCYCYLPVSEDGTGDAAYGNPPELLNAESATLTAPSPGVQGVLPGFADDADECLLWEDAPDQSPAQAARLASDHRHLIFVEPDLLPGSVEVTVAHELIHLADRVRGHPRKHRCHGYDSISADEAAVTGHDPEYLRAQLREETARREMALRRVRPFRYMYVCPICHREYPRVRRYTRPVSCGRCDKRYNAAFVLQLREILPGEGLGALSAEQDAAEGEA
jgi:hypothetical protein